MHAGASPHPTPTGSVEATVDDEFPTRSIAGITADDPVGALIGGRYRISALIATGGMARVYQATDEILGRDVAVKILHQHLVTDDAFVERFRHEAIAAARLSHPFIVSIFDTVSETDERGNHVEAIVMELVHGTTLRRRLDDVETLDPSEAIAVGVQVADALETAHRARVVHRDIKPANILLSTDGRVLVADFGIAKAAEGHDLTAEGSMLGTAKYLAPEQVEGTAVDGRSDVYALGVVLYESLTGRVPFQADTDTATALARLHQAPMRLRQVRANIPRNLEDVVLRAMARHPADRYEDAGQLRAALLGCMSGSPVIDTAVDDTDLIRRDGAARPGSPDRTPVPGVPLGPTVGAPVASAPPPVPAVQRERNWIIPTLLIVLVAVALAVVGVLFGQSRSGTPTAQAPPRTTVAAVPPAISTILAFDPPPGDGAENDQLLGNLTDGDPSTSWRTETYDSAPEIGVKDGVGLEVVLDDATELSSLTVTSLSDGWDAEVYVTQGAHGDSLDSWGDPVTAENQLGEGTVTFDLDGRTGDRILLWITRVGDAGRVEITDVQVR